MTKCTLACVATLVTASLIPADEKLAGVACRSVHLGYPAPQGSAFAKPDVTRTEYAGDFKPSAQPLTKARFTADANPSLSIDAGLVGVRYYLATGGATANGGTKLKATIDLPEAERVAPKDAP